MAYGKTKGDENNRAQKRKLVTSCNNRSLTASSLFHCRRLRSCCSPEAGASLSSCRHDLDLSETKWVYELTNFKNI